MIVCCCCEHLLVILNYFTLGPGLVREHLLPSLVKILSPWILVVVTVIKPPLKNGASLALELSRNPLLTQVSGVLEDNGFSALVFYKAPR